jgi:hypothetical protein
LVIPADRTVERVDCGVSRASGFSGFNQTDQKDQTNPRTCYLVSAAWLQERFELERALQLALDRCETAPAQKSSAWVRPAAERGDR